MVSDAGQQFVDIHFYRRNDHFQASQGFFIEASAVLFRPLLKCGMDWLRDVF
jgi:hypothetical protein